MAVVGTAIAGMLVKAGVGAVAASIIGNLLVSVAATALQTALFGQQEQPAPSGIKTRTSTAGDSTPQTAILGTYATAGNHVCPPMTHGRVGGTPNAFLTYVIDVGDAPSGGLAGLWIEDEKVTLGAPEPAGAIFPNFRRPVGGKYEGCAWVRFYDGTQTTASESLTTITGQDRPWTADMIGRGVPYAIVIFEYDDEVFRGQPTALFEVNGIRLYDPRRDSSVGGSGTQRWATPSTWQPSENPAVQVYNILRGITLPDGTRWGGEAEEADLPLSNWFAAMNECDRLVDGEPQFRTSTEIRIGPEAFGGQEPAAVIEELLRCCSGQISEYGGVWKMRAGAVGLPVAVLTDDDIIVSEEQTFEPFPGLQATYNGAHAQYPEPSEKWVSKEAPPRYNAAFEAQDGGRRLVASLALGACPYPKQVQHLMRAYVEDERRHRRHAITLPPDYAAIEPLDAVSWTSDRNGYSAKVGEVGPKVDGTRSLLQRISWRERDPADYDWQPGYELPTTVTPPVTLPLAPQAVPGWTVAATTIKDASGADRRPALVLGWDADQPGVRGIRYEVRVQGRTELVATGTTQAVSAGGLIVSEGVLPNTAMQARGRLVVNRATAWTPWTTVTTANVGLTDSDFVGGIRKLFTDQGLYAIEYFATLPTTGNFAGRMVFLTADGKLYRWNGSAWLEVVQGALQGALDETNFAQGIAIPRVVATLPTTGNYQGRLVTLSTDGRLYRYHNGGWTAEVAANTITGQLTAAQIGAGAIGADQIAAGAIVTSKLAVTDWTNLVGDDQIQDPAAWNIVAPAFNVVHLPVAGDNNPSVQSKGAWRINAAGANTTFIASRVAPAKPGEEFRYTARTWSEFAGATVYTALQFLDAAFVETGRIGSTASVAGWSSHSGNLAAPAGTAWVRTYVSMPASGYANGYHLWSAPTLRQRLKGDMVVDGTITGDKMVANTITGGLLATSGIITSAAQINNAVIGTAHIQNLSVGTIKIADGSVSQIWGTSFSDEGFYYTAYTNIASLSVTPFGDTSKLLIGIAGEMLTAGAEYTLVRLLHNGTVVWTGRVDRVMTGYNPTTGNPVFSSGREVLSVIAMRMAAAGANSIVLQAQAEPGGAPVSAGSVAGTLYVMEAKR